MYQPITTSLVSKILNMVINEKRDRSDILSFPCLVNSSSLADEKKTETESRSGILLFTSSSDHIYVITTNTVNASDGKTMTKDSGTHEVIFKVLANTYKVSATLVWEWECNDLALQLKKIFQPKHQWGLTCEGGESVTEFQVSILSSFALYRLDHSAASFSCLVSQAFPLAMDKIRSGTPLSTMTYPFGPDSVDIFTELVSSGIVSNVSVTDGGSLFMIDARCLPGSEGGAVLAGQLPTNQSCLIGIIVSPMCWKTRELVGISICCSIWHMLSSLQDSLPHHGFINEHKFFSSILSNYTKQSDQSFPFEPLTVRIDIGDIWGSGVICGGKIVGRDCQIIIGTCRHVLERKLSSDDEWVHMTIEGSSKRYTAKIIFAADEASAYDIAFLKLSANASGLEKFLSGLSICVSNPKGKLYVAPTCSQLSYTKGSPVFAKGFGLFDSCSGLGPTMSCGVISNVVHHKSTPVILHSTCLVHKGVSGGALTCMQSGKLKGILVNHIKDDDSDVAYPDANFSIPHNVFMPAVRRYLIEGDCAAFNCLNCFDKEIRSIWSMDSRSQFACCQEELRSKL